MLEDMVQEKIELVRFDDGEFIVMIGSNQVGHVLTNVEARQVQTQLRNGTFDLHQFQQAGVAKWQTQRTR